MKTMDSIIDSSKTKFDEGCCKDNEKCGVKSFHSRSLGVGELLIQTFLSNGKTDIDNKHGDDSRDQDRELLSWFDGWHIKVLQNKYIFQTQAKQIKRNNSFTFIFVILMKKQIGSIFELYTHTPPIPLEVRNKIEAIDEVEGYGSIIVDNEALVIVEFPKIKKWSFDKLYYGNNHIETNIFKNLVGTSFENLKTLSLFGNKLTTIEPITKLNAPTLSFLMLNNNQILEASPLTKIKSDGLSLLSIQQNYLTNIDCLAKLRWRSFQQIRFESNKSINTISINFLMKIQWRNKSSKMIAIDSNYRIIERKPAERLSAKLNKGLISTKEGLIRIA